MFFFSFLFLFSNLFINRRIFLDIIQGEKNTIRLFDPRDRKIFHEENRKGARFCTETVPWPSNIDSSRDAV